MESLRPPHAQESPPADRGPSRRASSARTVLAWLPWLVAVAVIGFCVWLLIEQVSMPAMAYSVPFEAWYRNWKAVLLASGVFLAFILAFLWPRGRAEWRNAGAYSAFLISLFFEMFGLPLTIYLLAPLLDVPAFAFGLSESHLWAYLLDRAQVLPLARGVQMVMTVSVALMAAGVALVAIGWVQVFRARYQLVTAGLYRIVRHPQYLGLMLIVVAFNIQWPTILTLLMAPVLIVMYWRQARREEEALLVKFGEAFSRYAARVPAFVPGLRSAVPLRGDLAPSHRRSIESTPPHDT